MIFFLSFPFFFPDTAQAQGKLTLDSCIARALEANYSIKIIRNEQYQAENNLNYGPFLPSVSVSAGQKQNITDSKVLTSGEDRGLDGSRSDALSAGVALNWRVFDGLAMFMTHARYKEMLTIGELRTKSALSRI